MRFLLGSYKIKIFFPKGVILEITIFKLSPDGNESLSIKLNFFNKPWMSFIIII